MLFVKGGGSKEFPFFFPLGVLTFNSQSPPMLEAFSSSAAVAWFSCRLRFIDVAAGPPAAVFLMEIEGKLNPGKDGPKAVPLGDLSRVDRD